MRKLIALLFFVPLFSVAQQYSEVKEVPNRTSDQLYKSAKEWFALAFKSANDVIQLDDPAEKKIIGKGVKQANYTVRKIPTFMNIYFTLSVQFKEGRYKYDIQSDEIKSADGKSYSYDDLKSMATEDGLKAYYKTMGVSMIVVGKKNFQENLIRNQLMVADIGDQLQNVVKELDSSLKKDIKADNW